jgi:hypothetical protein
MDLRLSDEQLMAQKTAAEFARGEVLPRAADIDREHRFPAELVRRMAELGFLGIAIPEQYGGAGLDTVSYVLALEEISRGCASSTGVIMSVNNSLVCDPLLKFGTEAQKQKWLSAARHGSAARLLCLVGAGGGLGCGGAEDGRAEGRRWLGAKRRQELDHQRSERQRLHPAVHGRSTGSAGGAQGDHDVYSADGSAGRAHRAAGQEAGHPRLAVVSDLPR